MRVVEYNHTVWMVIVITILLVATFPAFGQSSAMDEGWPKVHEVEGGKIVVYQPQVDSWQDYAHLQA